MAEAYGGSIFLRDIKMLDITQIKTIGNIICVHINIKIFI